MSQCTPESHREAKWLYVVAPDLSQLRLDGVNSMGTWLTCKTCLSTMLIEAPEPPREPQPALGVVI